MRSGEGSFLGGRGHTIGESSLTTNGMNVSRMDEIPGQGWVVGPKKTPLLRMEKSLPDKQLVPYRIDGSQILAYILDGGEKMPSKTTSVRHGLYIPCDLLSKIKEIARREKKSINKKIESIIQEWFDFQKSKNPSDLTRQDFHKLPLWRKKQILSDQANQALPYYQNENDLKNVPIDDIHEY